MRYERPKLKPLLLDGLLDRVENGPSDQQFVFFLGAGCSRSSGIPTARELVNQRWMPRLRQQFERVWLDEKFPNYDEQYAAQFYGTVFGTLFPKPEMRQWEIERIIEGRYPSVGYVVLAMLMSDPRYQPQFHTIFTTNFDDLIQDALFLYASRKPLVVTHESLISYVNARSKRPTIIKLHGDARIAPKNTDVETASLVREVEIKVTEILEGCALIFVGYGGGDRSISRIITGLPPSTIQGGIYWVNSSLPYDPDLFAHLASRDDAYWVRHRDFDDLMLRFSARLLGGRLLRREALDQLFANLNSNFFGTLFALLKSDGKGGENQWLIAQLRDNWASLTSDEQRMVERHLNTPAEQLYFCHHILGDTRAAAQHYETAIAAGANARLVVDFLEMQRRPHLASEPLSALPMLERLNTSDRAGETPLVLAAREGRADVVQTLLRLGSSVDLPDSAGRHPLAAAASAGHERSVEILLDAGAKVDAITSDGYTAFLLAALAGHQQVVERLLSAGADLNATTADGGTALLLASFNGHDEVVTGLIRRGSIVNHANAYGTTALIWAAHRGHDPIIRLLIDAGADMNAQNIFGKTALMEAVLNHYTVCVVTLLERGADTNAVSADGETVREQALRLELLDVVELLERFAGRSRRDRNADLK